MRLTLSVDLQDGDDLVDVAIAFEESVRRAVERGDESGRVRLDRTSESVGAWSVDDVPASAEATSVPWPSDHLVDTVDVALVPNGVEFTLAAGVDPGDLDETPQEGFVALTLDVDRAARIGRAIVAWTATR